jgi:hypothetical protein
MRNTKTTEDKKNETCVDSPRKFENVKTNSSPVCYADGPELRDEYRLETGKERSADAHRDGRK